MFMYHKSDWFKRLNSFEQQETIRQIEYKEKHWPGLPDGAWSKNPNYHYPHILPKGHLDKVFYPPIAKEVIDYCDKNDIAIHSEALNLRSSQVACFNVMFPLKNNPELAIKALKSLLPGVTEVDTIEFEYTGDAKATEWLGEHAGGKRGQNRTSIDVAIWWRNETNKILTLVEWKYTERSFGGCGGYVSKGNIDNGQCDRMQIKNDNFVGKCYLTQGKNDRHYWERMQEAGINLQVSGSLSGCPFRGPFYQLMRQFLLAAYLRKVDPVDVVDVALVSFKGNSLLLEISTELNGLGENVVEVWNKVLRYVPELRRVTVEEIAEGIGSSSDSIAILLAEYLKDRYGL